MFSYKNNHRWELDVWRLANGFTFFRLLRGMTQKYLGMALGFPEKSADVRLAQYETGSRTPKADLTAALAQVLDVSPHALSVPDIDSYVGLMHTLFTPRRSTTAGVTTTRSTTAARSAPRCRRRV